MTVVMHKVYYNKHGHDSGANVVVIIILPLSLGHVNVVLLPIIV